MDKTSTENLLAEETPSEETPPAVTPSPLDITMLSSREPSVTNLSESSLSDLLFPFNESFNSKSRRDKELQFLRVFDEQTLFIRNKELKCVNTPVQPLLTEEQIQTQAEARSLSFDHVKNNQSRKAIFQKETIASSEPAPRVDDIPQATFDPLLNVNFNSQFQLLDKFKSTISRTLIQNRTNKRIRQLSQYLFSSQSNAVSNLQQTMESKPQVRPSDLLALKKECCPSKLKFSEPEQFDPITPPEINIDFHRIEKSFHLYTPGLVERYQLVPFARTDITTFVPVPIPPPEKYPSVSEEQPVSERTVPQLEKDGDIQIVAQRDTLVLPKVISHPRAVQYFSFDPVYPLRPQTIQLPELDDEIGKASILSMPISEYEKMTLTKKTKTPVAPFEYTGIPTFSESGLYFMEEADPLDLTELDPDDDIDDINIQPKVKPITDFLTKPVSTKTKAHQIAEGVNDGQTQWHERQQKGATELIERLDSINKLMRDPTLELPLDDIKSFLRQ